MLPPHFVYILCTPGVIIFQWTPDVRYILSIAHIQKEKYGRQRDKQRDRQIERERLHYQHVFFNLFLYYIIFFPFLFNFKQRQWNRKTEQQQQQQAYSTEQAPQCHSVIAPHQSRPPPHIICTILIIVSFLLFLRSRFSYFSSLLYLLFPS